MIYHPVPHQPARGMFVPVGWSSGHIEIVYPIDISIMGYTKGYPTGAIAMARTTVFHSNRSQAVRLPKDVAFPEGVRDVTILRDGARRIIVPGDRTWDDFFATPGIDLGERDQPDIQDRQSF